MAILLPTSANIRLLKSTLMGDFKMRSAHATEAIAALIGFRSNSAYLATSKHLPDVTVYEADFDAFEVIDGIKQCPSGDYSDIQTFGERCAFGERCSFGKECSFGKWCSFGEDCSFGEECSFEGKGEYIGDYPFLAFVGFGSRIGSKVYFFNLQDGIYVRCGCWLSDIAGFRERVKAENADAMYLDLCDLVERKFNQKNYK